MHLIELAKEIGLSPKREGKTFNSPCPACQGTDRFIIWAESDKYWCRRCEIGGDAIQFCRDFLGMSYVEACNKLHFQATSDPASIPFRREELKFAQEPPLLWQEMALTFINRCHLNLMDNRDQLTALRKRMFNDETIIKYRLGSWMNIQQGKPPDLYLDRSNWGLPEEFKENGMLKKLWLPSGLVIPSFESDGRVMKLKIRRSAWHKEDKWPKYVEVSGSMQRPAWINYNEDLPVVIVESEFDALLTQQEAGDLCSTVALGGVAKRPDVVTHNLLKKCSLILYALDFDDAGKKAYLFWRQKYANLRPWPVPQVKSPGDAIKNGISLREWVLQGISEYSFAFKETNLHEK